MRTSRTSPTRAPRTATGPVQMCPGTILLVTLSWIAVSAAGTASGGGGITSGVPETVEIVTSSPLSTVRTGSSFASKKPQWTVSGAASIRWWAMRSSCQERNVPELAVGGRAPRRAGLCMRAAHGSRNNWPAPVIALAPNPCVRSRPFAAGISRMARDQIDMTPIETRDELVAWLAEGVKPKAKFRIGTEHEKFPFTIGGHDPVPYEGPRGIRALLDGMGML